MSDMIPAPGFPVPVIRPTDAGEVRAAMDRAHADAQAYQDQGQGRAMPDPRDDDQKSLPPPPDRFLATMGDVQADA